MMRWLVQSRGWEHVTRDSDTCRFKYGIVRFCQDLRLGVTKARKSEEKTKPDDRTSPPASSAAPKARLRTRRNPYAQTSHDPSHARDSRARGDTTFTFGSSLWRWLTSTGTPFRQANPNAALIKKSSYHAAVRSHESGPSWQTPGINHAATNLIHTRRPHMHTLSRLSRLRPCPSPPARFSGIVTSRPMASGP